MVSAERLARLLAAEKSLRSLKVGLIKERVTANLDNIPSLVNSLRQDRDDLVTARHGFISQLTETETKLHDTETLLTDKKYEIARLRDIVESLSAGIASRDVQLDDKEAKLKSLGNLVEQRGDMVIELQERVGELKTALAVAYCHIRELGDERETLAQIAISSEKIKLLRLLQSVAGAGVNHAWTPAIVDKDIDFMEPSELPEAPPKNGLRAPSIGSGE